MSQLGGDLVTLRSYPFSPGTQRVNKWWCWTTMRILTWKLNHLVSINNIERTYVKFRISCCLEPRRRNSFYHSHRGINLSRNNSFICFTWDSGQEIMKFCCLKIRNNGFIENWERLFGGMSKDCHWDVLNFDNWWLNRIGNGQSISNSRKWFSQSKLKNKFKVY